MKNKELLRKIKAVFSANIVIMIFGVLNGIILPKYLSIDSYAQIKTYQLIYAFIGLLHFGTADAIQIKYGGVLFDRICDEEFAKEIASYRTLFLIEELLLLIVSFFSRDFIIIALASTVLFSNIISCYKILFQAIGMVERYSVVTLGIGTIKFLENVICIFVLGSDDYHLLIVLYVFTDVIICAFLELSMPFVKIRTINLCADAILQGVQIGGPILIGNVIVNLLTSIDRWFVKIARNNVEFAFYSFAVSIEQLLVVLFKPFQISLYSYFCRNKESESKIRNICSFIFLGGAILCSSIFPIKWVVTNYIEKYTNALNVMIILFATIIPCGIINSFYINLYKVYECPKKYFYRNVTVVIIAILLDFIVYITVNNLIFYAWATFAVSIIWYVLSIYDFKQFMPAKSECIAEALSIGMFIVISMNFSGITGVVAYLSMVAVLNSKTIKKLSKSIREED